jgi:hypothetical protein
MFLMPLGQSFIVEGYPTIRIRDHAAILPKNEALRFVSATA